MSSKKVYFLLSYVFWPVKSKSDVHFEPIAVETMGVHGEATAVIIRAMVPLTH